MSMKKIIYIAFAVAALAAVSCVKTDFGSDFSGEGITLSFTCGEMSTKADDDPSTVAGINYENRVDRIDYFVFPVVTTTDDGGVETVSVEDGAKPVYWNYITTTNKLALSYQKTIKKAEFSEMFPDGALQAMIFAVANYNGSTELSKNLTWKEMHELEVGQTFTKDGGKGFGLRWPRPKNPSLNADDLFFVMTGEKVVDLKTAGSTAIAKTIPLRRLASKVTVTFTFENVTDNLGVTWKPQPSGEEARVYLSNAICNTTLGGPLTRALKPDGGTETQPWADRDIFEYAYDFLKDFENGALPYYYTYPISMDEGDDNQPYIKLVLPWYGYKTIDDNEVLYKQKEVYYKIALPRETISDPNCIYNYSVNVNIVGSDKEVLLEGEYIVRDWLTRTPILSNVATGRYISLDIPKDEYDMYTNNLSIKFVSSGEVEITKLGISTQNLKGRTPVPDWFINDDFSTAPSYGPDGKPTHNYVKSQGTTDAAQPGVTLPNWATIDGTYLVINHTLNTNINSAAVDIAPFTFHIRLHLKGETATTFDRTITITQYPPIYATTRASQNGNETVFLNGTKHNWSTTPNVYNRSGSDRHSMGSIGQRENDMSTSRVKTIVSVSTLAALDITKYTAQGVGVPMIGDPTTTLAEGYPRKNQQEWRAGDLRDITKNNTPISEDYRYADLSKSNIIAPKFMVASGFGGCPDNKQTWIYNVERCAAYQEDGYPAGRWRLPTEAEILFVYTLGNDLGLIDNPFYTGTGTSGGSHYYANSGRTYWKGNFEAFSNSGTYSTRCVYDLWYWGDEPYDNNGNKIPADDNTTSVATQWLGFMTSK